MKKRKQPENILILTQWYGTEDSWGYSKSLAEKWIQSGWNVEVLAGVPYSFGTEKILPGYKMCIRQVEFINGIKVIRLPLYISQSKSGFKRMLCYASFGLAAATIGQFGIRRPDIVFCYNLPTLGWAARLFRLLRGSKLVYMIQDLWPESVTGSGMAPKNKLFNRLLKWWSDRFYRSADALTGLSPGFKKNLCIRGIPEEKITVVYNWTNEKQTDPISDNNSSEKNAPFTITYAGNMGVMQGLDVVLDAAKLAQKENINVLFRLIGDGVDLSRLKMKAADLGLNNVEFVPRIPSSLVNTELQKSDVLLVHLKKLDIFNITIPSKVQAYLYAGKPILCGLQGDAAQLVRDAKAGICFEPENPYSLLSAIQQMNSIGNLSLVQMGRKGRQYYLEKMSLSVGSERISSLIFNLFR